VLRQNITQTITYHFAMITVGRSSLLVRDIDLPFRNLLLTRNKETVRKASAVVWRERLQSCPQIILRLRTLESGSSHGVLWNFDRPPDSSSVNALKPLHKLDSVCSLPPLASKVCRYTQVEFRFIACQADIEYISLRRLSP